MKTTNLSNGHFQQKYYSEKAVLALIGFLSAFIPLSTDLYLPALPSMTVSLNTTEGLVNTTLVVFFVVFAIGIFIWGPLSDRYGRKPIILIGLIIYVIGSISCALSANVYQLIVFRALQAVGGSASSTVAMAMVKDMFGGRRRESVLAIVQSMIIISPVVAPIFGAFLLKLTSWQGTFWFLSGTGILAIVLTVFFQESLVERSQGTLLKTFHRISVVIRNPGFFSLLLLFSFAPMPMMAFIAGSSYIFINHFNLSEQQYSFFFALNGICAMLGPLIYMMLLKWIKRGNLITVGFFIVAICGGLIFVWGRGNQWFFILLLLPSTIVLSAMRPASANLMLEQQEGDTGTASSLINGMGILIGSTGMVLISQGWSSIIVVLAVIYIAVGLFSCITWLMIQNRSFIIQIPDAEISRQT